jgi:hypothetical protein
VDKTIIDYQAVTKQWWQCRDYDHLHQFIERVPKLSQSFRSTACKVVFETVLATPAA